MATAERKADAGTVPIAGRNTTRQYRLGLLGLLLTLLLFFTSLPSASSDPSRSRAERARIGRQQFNRAEKLRTALEGKPRRARSKREYLRVIRTYRRVYDIAPFTGRAARALRARAELYQEMGRQFGANYFRQAIRTYRFLLKEYPYGTHRFDALFTIAQIQWADLKDPKAAQKTFAEYVKRYPKSKQAARARQALKDIRQREQQAKAARAAPSERVHVNNIRYWNTANYTRVVIDLDGEVTYQGARIPKPDRIFFDLFGTQLSSPLVGKTFEVEDGLLRRIRVAENRRGITRVVLEVTGANAYSVFPLPNPFRLVVDVRGDKKKRAKKPARLAAAKAQPPTSLPQPPAAPQPTSTGDRTLTRALGLKINRIVLDPGHGGHDTGTIGPNGFMEKDLALDVARRLGKLLEEKLGAEVLYTREDDTFLPLENRSALANEKQADLFLSLHANYSRNRRIRGVETFYLNFTSDQEVLELAARENALSQKSVHELQDLVRKITRNEKIDESRELARALQVSLYQELRRASRTIQNRGVKQAPFVVLIGADMPSVLSEIAFLSNARDERLLKTSRWRQRVAQALFTGITNYLQSLNSADIARLPAAQTATTPPPH
ncbi:MAG: N-acetylmuramoyl-L-alanine amidase [Terriglobia bacterium]